MMMILEQSKQPRHDSSSSFSLRRGRCCCPSRATTRRTETKKRILLILGCLSLLEWYPDFTHAQQQQQQQAFQVPVTTTWAKNHSPLSSSPLTTASPPTAEGPIDDIIVTCNMEDLEQANDSQLYTILHDLKQTAFFRTFRVDLSHRCPLRSWRTAPVHDKTKDNKHDDEDDKSLSDKNKKKDANTLKLGGDDDEDEDDEFICPSSQHDEEDDDEDAVPQCNVQGMDSDDTAASLDDTGFLGSSALFSLSRDGFQSQQQKDTYTWKRHSDRVVTPRRSNTKQESNNNNRDDDLTFSSSTTSDCDQDQSHGGALLPKDFWVDLCTRVRSDDPEAVNLSLNPERNTGYNGTHIWTAIYEENCRALSPKAADNDDVCLEERVLYRLLSGLHASTTLSIANNYYPPSKRKGRPDWEPNPTFFMEKFSAHPDHVRNLHFSYVVLLRALTKAAGFLYKYDIRTGDVVEDETSIVLLRRLLDSSILQSCSGVFSAFDESLMFASVDEINQDFSLQHNFKDVFFNISSILDCVQCQQCKLHGKMAMLGYGTALKILFSPPSADPSDFARILSRNEIVALINTLAKFSESIRYVRELTHLYLLSEQEQQVQSGIGEQPHDTTTKTPTPSISHGTTTTHVSAPPVLESIGAAESANLSVGTVDVAVGAIATLARQGLISSEREAQLIQMALSRHPELLVLARHYGTVDLPKFLQLLHYIKVNNDDNDIAVSNDKPDAIVVGSGLAGMAAALTILDRGGRVVIIEKEHLLGGNSNKASSGINACCFNSSTGDALENGDTVDMFRNDTTRSAGDSVHPDLINVLVQNSASAVSWLRDRVGVDLSLKAQLGGHSSRRTHRPSNGMAGAEIIYGMQKAIKSYQKMSTTTGGGDGDGKSPVTILTDCKVTALIQNDQGHVVGVDYVDLTGTTDGHDETQQQQQLYADHVVLATGGFAADRSSGSYLAQYRPELLEMPTTAGAFSTGDGITLATALGANRIDMDKVQVHPTGTSYVAAVYIYMWKSTYAGGGGRKAKKKRMPEKAQKTTQFLVVVMLLYIGC